MTALLRQLGLTAAFFAALHAGVWALSRVAVPQKESVDTLAASETVYLTDARLVAAGIAGMAATEKKKLWFLGPSNVTSAFRPREVGPLFPDFEVHQLALGFHNVTHARLEARLLCASVPPEVRAQSVVALGLWYGAFADNGAPKLFDMESVFLQSGLYARRGGRVEPRVGPRALPLLVQALRPFHFTQFLAESRLGTHRPHLEDRFVNAPAVGREKEESLASLEDKWLRRADRSLADEQFDELVGLAQDLDQAGASLVLVEMALPRWHTAHASYLPAYAAQRARVWPRLQALPRVRAIDLSGDEALVPDEGFYDLNHVTREASHLWAKALRREWDAAAALSR